MRDRQAACFLLAASLAFGCGDGLLAWPDAGDQSDGGVATCNPYTQQGCLPGQKCSLLLVSTEPRVERTECQPNGSIPIGGSCEPAKVGEYDDCRADEVGSVCYQGVCTPVCRLGADDCGDGSCQDFTPKFDDLPRGTALGLCLAPCDPVGSPNVDDTSCPGDLGCYLAAAKKGTTFCAGVPDQARGNFQGAVCTLAPNGGCFLNGCESGYGPLLPDLENPGGPFLCTAFCRPEISYRGGPGRAEGAVGADCSPERIGAAAGEGPYQCRFVQSFFRDAHATPPNIGFCVPVTEQFGDCELFDWQRMLDTYQAALDAGEDPTVALVLLCKEDPSDPFSPLKPECRGYNFGCLSLEELAKLKGVI